jgi:1,4-alpha-glucan branching enzyme
MGKWKEILNTDSKHYGGQNRGNCGHVNTDNFEMHGMASLSLYLPPLTALAFMPESAF